MFLQWVKSYIFKYMWQIMPKVFTLLWLEEKKCVAKTAKDCCCQVCSRVRSFDYLVA